jgi:ribose transport system permease protein
MKQFLSEYGMIVVLLALCAGFSVATWTEQYPTGAAAAEELARAIAGEHPAAARVLIVGRKATDDEVFARELKRLLEQRGFAPVTVVIQADPQAGRAGLEKLARAKARIDVIAATYYTHSSWRFLERIPELFPDLGRPVVVQPVRYYWPNFLKLENLLNIANQIAVIAILAVGMTLVIITGGIDLSVGSLIALSAVTAAWLICAAGGHVANDLTPQWSALIWAGVLFVVAAPALVLSRKKTGTFIRAFAVVSLGAVGLILIYALTPVFAAPLAAGLASLGPTPLVMTGCCLLAILLCAALGLFSGSMVTYFRVPPFIVTLAMMLVASGLASKISRGESIHQVPDSFIWLGRGADLFGLPNAVLLMLLLYGLAHLLMTRMALGRYIYAVGGNAEAARLSGVPVQRVLLFVYTMSGALAGLGGVVMASQLKSGNPNYGQMYELYVIAAAVVGGCSLSGGEGRILGTLIGAFIIAVIQNGMNLIGMTSYDQRVVLGLVILAAVLFDRIKRRSLAEP